MAEVYPDAILEPTKVEMLTAWMPSKRWYTSKGVTPQLTRLGGFRFEDPEHQVGMEVHILLDSAVSPGVVYQVPTTYRDAPLEGAEEHLLGEMQHSVLGRRWVYDAAADPVFVQSLMTTLSRGGESDKGYGGHGDNSPASGRPTPGTDATIEVLSSKILAGEQSNTSIVVQARVTDASGQASTRGLIVKLFRVLSEGENPDVVLQTALAGAGSTLVPQPVGSLHGQWASPTGGGTCHGDLAFAQEFLPGTTDAWRVASKAVASGEDFTARARALGAATAAVHADLANTMPTQEAAQDRREALVQSWATRRDAALQAVPGLEPLRPRIDEVFAAAARADWPQLQRIHGDYHLGQVLDVPERGWVLLDFEGEPLRPLAERVLPDLPLRDVAGMLRSFDYAAGSRAKDAPQAAETAADWAAAARTAFLDGYASAAVDPRSDESAGALLRALELDKALYEVVYETRNRPDWVDIPSSAISRLTDSTMSRRKASTMTTTPATADPLPVDPHILDLLVRGGHGDPHSILGAHPYNGGYTIRALRPMAASVSVALPGGIEVPMNHDYEGVWVVQLEGHEISDYRLRVDYGDGYGHEQDDPYRFWPTLGEVDLHLIGEGRHEELWKVLGSHIRSYTGGAMGDVEGTSFAVWAPNARAIRLVGDFNSWDGQAYPMRTLGSSGVWELFVPGVGENNTYKYDILGADGYWRTKADPLARATERPPNTASVVTRSHYEWSDEEWITRRSAITEPQNEPMSVYECHLGSWRQDLSYVEAAEHLVNYVADLGYTHIEFMPLAEHPYAPSWGYQVTGYYAPTSRFGSPDEFRYLVDKLHQAGIGVIIDWVPAHFPKDGFALGRFDGQPLYEHPDPRRGEHKDWGTYIFDFGRPQVRNFLVANACYWIEEFHIDGLRVDAVASMLYLDYSRNDGEWYPNEYGGRENLQAVQLLQETNATLYRRYPGVITAAEESTSWGGVTKPTYMGGLGFGLKWNMGWMHDTLAFNELQPIYRQYHHHQLTFSMVYQYSENFILPISHDEVVYGKGSMLRKMPGDRWEQLSNLRAYYAFMWSHPGKQLLFMGQEFGQESEWAESRSLDWWLLDQEPHWRLHKLVKDINHLYTSHPALWQLDNDFEGFQWIDANDSTGNTFSFLRFGKEDESGKRPVVASVTNFSGMEHHQLRIGLPHPGVWREILNTDSAEYGGAGMGNLGQITAEPVPWHGLPYSATITMQKLSAVWFEPAGEGEGDVQLFSETKGVDRPELSTAPVADEERVRSALSSADLTEPRVGTSGERAPAAPSGQKPGEDERGLGWPASQADKPTSTAAEVDPTTDGPQRI